MRGDSPFGEKVESTEDPVVHYRRLVMLHGQQGFLDKLMTQLMTLLGIRLFSNGLVSHFREIEYQCVAAPAAVAGSCRSQAPGSRRSMKRLPGRFQEI